MTTSGAIDLPLQVFGSYCPELPPASLPAGLSPWCQDVEFIRGGVKTRPGLFQQFQLPGNPTINYLRSYITPTEVLRLLALDSLGNVYKETPMGTLTSVIGAVTPGSYGKSATCFGREYMAFGDGINGLDIPRQYDDTYFDRVSQVGPGAAMTVVDGAAGNIAAGVHQFSVVFVTRQGYITAPAPPANWTAAGAKVATVTNIPVGPPNIVARILIFTGVGGANFFYTGPNSPITSGNMIIPNNTATTATIDFTDPVLLAGINADELFNLVELGECAGVIDYADRMFWWGERNKVNNFNNLTFDGGFGAAGSSPGLANSTKNAGAAADDGGPNAGWTPTAGNVPASATVPSLGLTNYLLVSNFGFAIPSNATILGILVTSAEKSNIVTSFIDNSIMIMKGGALVGSDHNAGQVWLLAGSNHIFGGNSDLWGVGWTPTDINAAGFGVAIRAVSADSSNTRSCTVTAVSIEVFYSTPASGGTVGPLGWTQGGTYAGGASALTNSLTAYWGDAFAITGDGATAIRGLITQGAAVDFRGVAILNVGVAYRVRARIASAGGLNAGTLHINLQSTTGGFTTPGLYVTASQLTGAYKEFDGLLTSALTVIPADLVLQVYADGTPNNNGVFLVDCIEIYPSSQPYNLTTIRASFNVGGNTNLGPESFDGVTGLLQPQPYDGQGIRCMFKLREYLYIVKERSLYVTQDDGVNEPANWSIRQISGSVGTPSVNGVAIGEDWAIIANRNGLFMFNGGEPTKISQEVQSNQTDIALKFYWDNTNWTYGQLLWTLVDTLNKRILVSLPFIGEGGPGGPPSPGIFYLDYRPMNDSSDIVSSTPIHTSYAGKVINYEHSRKWSPWNIKANCAAIIERADGTGQVFLGAGGSWGQIWSLSESQFYDNINSVQTAINSFYVPYGFPSHDEEQGLQLGSHRKDYTYLTAYVEGAGLLTVNFYTENIATTAQQLTSWSLGVATARDHEQPLGGAISAERGFFQFGTNAVGSWFKMQKFVPSLKPSVIPLRGVS